MRRAVRKLMEVFSCMVRRGRIEYGMNKGNDNLSTDDNIGLTK